jgi:hypothetical protein
LLGLVAKKDADKCFEIHFAALRRSHPGVKHRLIRQVHAICSACDARLSYQEESRNFMLTEATF